MVAERDARRHVRSLIAANSPFRSEGFGLCRSESMPLLPSWYASRRLYEKRTGYRAGSSLHIALATADQERSSC
jgi:hypothetical protein